jgi:hypothetical protein
MSDNKQAPSAGALDDKDLGAVSGGDGDFSSGVTEGGCIPELPFPGEPEPSPWDPEPYPWEGPTS